jgi:hypothetical protein
MRCPSFRRPANGSMLAPGAGTLMAHTRRKLLVVMGRRALQLSWCVATMAALGFALLGLPAGPAVVGNLQPDVTLSLVPSTQSVQPGGQFSRSPGTRASMRAGTARSCRCRARRRATAPPAAPTGTIPATSRFSWIARSAAPGAMPKRSAASRPSTRAGTATSRRCRAHRRATAAPVDPTETPASKSRRGSSTRSTARGPTPSRPRGRLPSTRPHRPRSTRCRAPRRATAAPGPVR